MVASTTTKPGGANRVAANSGWQLGSFAARAVGGLGAVALLARTGGPRDLGLFLFGQTFAGMFPFYWGLPNLIAREVARKREDSRMWVESSTFLTLIIGGLCIVLFAAGSALVGASDAMRMSIVLGGAGLVLDSVARVQFAVFWGWERMSLEAIATVIQEATLLAGVAIVVAMGGGLRGVLWVFVASRGVGVVVGWIILARTVGPFVPHSSLAHARDLFRRGTPFAINETLGLAERRADAVMLGIIKGPVSVGLYTAATNLVLYFNVLARSVNRAIYPRMSRAWLGARERVDKLRNASLRGLALVAMPVTIGSLLLAPEIVRFLYGPKFDRAILTYRLLIVVIPLRMLGNTFSVMLDAVDRQTRRTVAVTVAALVNFGLNLYFIPRWSYLGAAITTVISETGLFAAYIVLTREVTGPSRVLQTLSVPVVASLPLVGCVLATINAPMPIPIIAGAGGYGAGLLAIVAARSGRVGRSPRALATALVRPGP
jgi:O-antigen/teichoic acid export membrane protein